MTARPTACFARPRLAASPVPWSHALSTRQVAELLGRRPSTIRRWRNKAKHAEPGRYPPCISLQTGSHAASRLVVYDAAALLEWLERAAARTAPEAAAD